MTPQSHDPPGRHGAPDAARGEVIRFDSRALPPLRSACRRRRPRRTGDRSRHEQTRPRATMATGGLLSTIPPEWAPSGFPSPGSPPSVQRRPLPCSWARRPVRWHGHTSSCSSRSASSPARVPTGRHRPHRPAPRRSPRLPTSGASPPVPGAFAPSAEVRGAGAASFLVTARTRPALTAAASRAAVVAATRHLVRVARSRGGSRTGRGTAERLVEPFDSSCASPASAPTTTPGAPCATKTALLPREDGRPPRIGQPRADPPRAGHLSRTSPLEGRPRAAHVGMLVTPLNLLDTATAGALGAFGLSPTWTRTTGPGVLPVSSQDSPPTSLPCSRS